MKDTVLLQIGTVALNSKLDSELEIEYYFMNDSNKIYCKVKDIKYIYKDIKRDIKTSKIYLFP